LRILFFTSHTKVQAYVLGPNELKDGLFTQHPAKCWMRVKASTADLWVSLVVAPAVLIA